jgi:hypothetical protein
VPTAAELFTRASVLLQDEQHVRWKLSELTLWINDGLRAVVLAKPSAKSESVVLSLVAGTLQTLVDADHLALLRVTRNIVSEGPPRVGGRIIRATARDILDASAPDWHSPDHNAKEVRQYVYDEAVPREFYVYPGNNGAGTIEAVVAIMPELIEADGSPEALGSYNQEIDLPEPWIVPLQDFVLFRAFSKDAVGADPGRAGSHYTAFATGVGLKVQVERVNSPNTGARVTST